jgi:hypothetical protein
MLQTSVDPQESILDMSVIFDPNSQMNAMILMPSYDLLN